MADEKSAFLLDFLDNQGEKSDTKKRKMTTAINKGGDSDDLEFKSTVTNRARQMSLATKKNSNSQKLVQNALKLCKNPIKLAWTDVYYEVEVPATDNDRLEDPSIGAFKPQPIVRCVTGFAPPG